MEVHRNEMIAPRKVPSIHDTYKEDTELGDSLTTNGGSNSPRIPDDDAATAAIQHPLRDEGAKIQQDIPLTTAETGVMKKTFAQDLGVLKKLKEMMEKLSSSDSAKKIITEDSELLKKIKETMEKIISSEWSLAGIRELIEKFSTTTQFDLHGIQNVEENIKDQNLNLEIGEFSLVRIMEKARDVLHGEETTDSHSTGSFLAFLTKQEAEETGGNTNNTPDSDDSKNYNLLNIEA